MQAIKERRSIRKYRPDPISQEALNTILEAARWAPSWANTQCWRLIVVQDQEIKSKLADALKSRKPGGKNSATEAMRQAPIVIAACAERALSGYYKTEDIRLPSTEKGEWWYMFDVALAMQNASLAAHALGLGTVHVGLFDTSEVTRILGIPPHLAVVELMVLGWPDEIPPTRSRKELSEFVFYEKYPGEDQP